MRVWGVIGLFSLLGACAFSGQVQRFGVEYNSALAGMNNEQTLLNILRARDGMPTHFSSVAQFRGNLNLTAGASLNGQLRGQALTEALASGFTNTTANSASTTTIVSAPGAPPSTTTGASTVITPVTNGSTSSTIANGVDLFTPQVSGTIVSGSAFDVDVFDTQKFYQGITTAIPFPTIETLFNRGMDNRVIMALTIARVEIRLRKPVPGHARGDTIGIVTNNPSDPVEAAGFMRFMNCYSLGSGTLPEQATNLAPMSRFTRGPDDHPIPLPLDKITAIDGEHFGLSSDEGLGDPANDNQVFLTRITPARRSAHLFPKPASECATTGDRIVQRTLESGEIVEAAVPSGPPRTPLYLGHGVGLVWYNDALHEVPVDVDITFRSPEGLFTYIGEYLRDGGARWITIGGNPLFSIAVGRDRDALAEANYRGRIYSLVNDAATGTQNAQIFTLLQQLINLSREAADRPTAIPVRAIP